MPGVVFVAPFLLPATARFATAVAALPGVRLGLLTQDAASRLPSALAARTTVRHQVADAFDPRRLAAAEGDGAAPGRRRLPLRRPGAAPGTAGRGAAAPGRGRDEPRGGPQLPRQGPHEGGEGHALLRHGETAVVERALQRLVSLVRMGLQTLPCDGHVIVRHPQLPTALEMADRVGVGLQLYAAP